MTFFSHCPGEKFKDLMCSQSTLCLHSVRKDSFSQCSSSKESSFVGQYYLFFSKMTSLLEVLFVKHTMQVSQQAQLLIFPS